MLNRAALFSAAKTLLLMKELKYLLPL